MVYTQKIDPEVSFLNEVIKRKIQHSKSLPLNGRNLVIVGGSSCMFSVNMDVLEQEFGISGTNLGVNAATGRAFQVDLALQVLTEGDVLVLAFETQGWSNDEFVQSLPLASKVWFNKSFAFTESKLVKIGYSNKYNYSDLRLGGRHVFTMGLKMLLGREKYRYNQKDIHAGGYLTTDYIDASMAPISAVNEIILSSEMATMLNALKKELASKNIGLAVSLPWHFMTEDVSVEQRRLNNGLVEELRKHVVVLEDPMLGVNSSSEDYADTTWHLSREGALKRTRIIGKSLLKEFPFMSQKTDE